MFGSVQKWLRQWLRPSVPAFYLILTAILVTVPHLQAQTVATYDFEDGTTQGWSSFNGATTPGNTTAAAYSGSHSLLTATATSGSGGPSIALNSVLQPGAKYTITGYVMLTPGESATNANFTIKRSDPSCSGGTCYDTIGAYQVPVSSSGWVQIGGSYTASTTATAMTLYAQLVGASSTQSFYLDAVVITQTAPPPGGTPVALYNFQDGGLDGWAPFGSATLTNTTAPLADPTGNAHSLLVSNRTATYMGPSLNLLSVNNLVAGATYQVTAYVLLAAPDSSNPTATLSTDTTDCASPSGLYGNSSPAVPLSSSVWTKVQGTVSFSDQPVLPPACSFTCSPAARLTPSTSAMSPSVNSPHPRSAPASRTTPASAPPSRMVASTGGPRAAVPPPSPTPPQPRTAEPTAS
jgi:endo-1,4-beta-xylanase